MANAQWRTQSNSGRSAFTAGTPLQPVVYADSCSMCRGNGANEKGNAPVYSSLTACLAGRTLQSTSTLTWRSQGFSGDCGSAAQASAIGRARPAFRSA